MAPLPPHILSQLTRPTPLNAHTNAQNEPSPLRALDTSRYALKAPSGDDETSVEAWTSSCNLANALVEAQYDRLINLELLNSFGQNAWKIHAFQLEAMSTSLDRTLVTRQLALDDLNRRRMMEQAKAHHSLTSLDYKYNEVSQKNLHLSLAIAALEAQVEQLEGRVSAK